jgi:hypoxanthine-DNA glycosylase
LSGSVCSFPPLARSDARVLILGSMPGKASLDAQRYYAHPHNAFWRILSELVGFAVDAPYDERVAAVLAARIAVWDVLASCVRPGSLDSAIEADSMVINDFAGFFRAHPQIVRVGFNGATSERLYRLHARRHLRSPMCREAAHREGALLPDSAGAQFGLREEQCVAYVRLPSTSPANASVPYAHKLAAWRTLLAAL